MEATRVHVYPADFVHVVKSAFPGNARMHEHLDNSSNYVGRLLEEIFQHRITPVEVVRALDGGLEATLAYYQQMKQMIVAHDLYDWWTRITANWEGP